MRTASRAAVLGAGLAATLLPFSGALHARTFDLGGQGTTLETLTNLTYSAAWRLDDPDETLLANLNGDDGNRNFGRGAMINNRLAILGELHLRHRPYGLFLRGSAFYDDAYRRDSDHDSPATLNKDEPADRFTDEARKYLGGRARLLDAYVYGSWLIGDTALEVRAGRQVVSWGESLFFPNTSGAQSPADATKSNVAGTEVKEILLPVGQLYAQWGITPRWSIAAYWQWEWLETELNPVGGYFSSVDTLGPGADRLLVPQLASLGRDRVPRAADLAPDDDGQWGISTRFLFGDATEVGVYHLRYHDKNPTGLILQMTTIEPSPGMVIPVPASYQVIYADDIRMSAISVASELYGTAVAGEVSYREGAGINIDVDSGTSVTPTPGRGDAIQANLSATRLLLPTAFWDTLTLVGEVSWLQLQDVEPLDIAGTLFDQPSNGHTATAYQLMAALGYLQVFPGWDLTLALIHGRQFHGKSAINGALGSFTGEGDERYSVGLGGRYLQNLELQVSWNGYRGTPDLTHKALADRSHIAFSAKYSF